VTAAPPVRITVLDYAMGNIHSVARAAATTGALVDVCDTADAFDADVDGIVLPGQGHFATCVTNLRARGLDDVVADWVRADRPMLGICVGMQILVERSDEGDAEGLGVLPGHCARVGGRGLPVPHMGWDQQTWPTGSKIFAGINPATRFYYCHSYAVAPGTGASETYGEYGTTYVAALERSSVWAVQFHPEKSSSAGLAVWRNFAGFCARHAGTAAVS
jgi:glutamine amidotransferase